MARRPPLSTTIVTIGREISLRLLAEAAASPDREICGLLFGTADAIDGAVAAANVAADPASRFEIDPAALIAAHRHARGGGRAAIGCYHSHPSGPAVPSASDRAGAADGALWLILARGGLRLWLAGPGGFREVTLHAR